jgi:hypothetical protein
LRAILVIVFSPVQDHFIGFTSGIAGFGLVNGTHKKAPI